MQAAAPLYLVKITFIGITTIAKGLEDLKQYIKGEQSRSSTLTS